MEHNRYAGRTARRFDRSVRYPGVIGNSRGSPMPMGLYIIFLKGKDGFVQEDRPWEQGIKLAGEYSWRRSCFIRVGAIRKERIG
ncbi:hypothetical protein CRP01_01590 [Flavilitoribacter nigricans DSM 23189 = NBRC 102662]|uniref:Uncharacterized protein n=1 Tax=Flavilitoribacter nigricans (strain ATCC 23147 / DSM 23189 / NBRC 102662 / NCIMB 1420 / SS-2) TaxID=1122177 RepID=A0A2D0NJG0_FLAN2|nr:hypothetical protein CRP01_01590 [Flavilitoribacter nigricans DSM 23189 = NBRC 102662]